MPTIEHTPEAFAQANGIQLCWDSFGNPADPPLLLIMGLAAQMIAWDEEFCAAIAGHGFRVLRFDNRDIGRSTRFTEAGLPDVQAAMAAALRGEPVPAPYTLRDMAGDAIGLLDALGIERAHVVGASMGGAIAQTMAIHSPQRLRSLTSIMATTGAPGLPPPTPEAIAVLFKPTPTDEAGYVASHGQTWKVLRAGSYPEEEARDADRARRVFARGLNPAGVARQLTAIFASGSRQAALRSVRVPALVIHGADDPLVPVACGIDTANSIPGARIETLPAMGHALPRTVWPRVVDAIVAHARRADAGAPLA